MSLFDRNPRMRLSPGSREVHDVIEFTNGRITRCNRDVLPMAESTTADTNCRRCLSVRPVGEHVPGAAQTPMARAGGRR